jgi:hypothetical protein
VRVEKSALACTAAAAGVAAELTLFVSRDGQHTENTEKTLSVRVQRFYAALAAGTVAEMPGPGAGARNLCSNSAAGMGGPK